MILKIGCNYSESCGMYELTFFSTSEKLPDDLLAEMVIWCYTNIGNPIDNMAWKNRYGTHRTIDIASPKHAEMFMLRWNGVEV